VDSIRKNLSSPIGRFIPVPAPAPDDSTPINSSFFDTLSSELELEEPKTKKGDSAAKSSRESNSPGLVGKDPEPIQVETGFKKLDATNAVVLDPGPQEELSEDDESHLAQEEESNQQETTQGLSKTTKEEELIQNLDAGSDPIQLTDSTGKEIEDSNLTTENIPTLLQNTPETTDLSEQEIVKTVLVEVSNEDKKSQEHLEESTEDQSKEIPELKKVQETDIAVIEGLDEIESLLLAGEIDHELKEDQKILAIPAVSRESKSAPLEISTEAVGRVLKDAEVQDSTVELKKSIEPLHAEFIEEEAQFLQELDIAEKDLLSAGIDAEIHTSELSTNIIEEDALEQILERDSKVPAVEARPQSSIADPIAALATDPIEDVKTEQTIEPEEIVDQAEDEFIRGSESERIEDVPFLPSQLDSETLEIVPELNLEVGEILPPEQGAFVDGEQEPPKTSEIVDQIIELFENIESLQAAPQLREKLSRLVALIQNLVKEESVSPAQTDLNEKERLLNLLSELRQLIENPDSESAKSLFTSNSGQEMLKQVQELLVQSLDHYKGRLELGQEFELVDPIELQDKKTQSKSKLLNAALIEHMELNEESEAVSSEKIKSGKRPNPISPLESGTQNSRAGDALARVALKIAGEYAASSPSSSSNGSSTPQQGESGNSGGGQGQSQVQDSVLNLSASQNSPAEEEGFENMLLSRAKVAAKSEVELTHMAFSGDQVEEADLGPVEGAKTPRVIMRGASSIGSSSFQESIMKQVLHQVRALRPPKVNVLRVTLNPRELGKLHVEIKNAQEGLKIRFQAENMAVKEVIDRNVSMLRDSMKAQGLDINKIEVEVREESTSDQGNRRGEKGREEKSRKKNKGTAEFSLEEQTSSNESDEHKINEYA